MNLTGLAWRKSSYGGTESACVELAETGHGIAIRDSKAPAAGTLVFPKTAVSAVTAVAGSHARR